MPDLCFDIQCHADEQRVQGSGIDQITFYMSANKGHALHPLSKLPPVVNYRALHWLSLRLPRNMLSPHWYLMKLIPALVARQPCGG